MDLDLDQVNIEGDRITFANQGVEEIIIIPNITGSQILFGLSSIISTSAVDGSVRDIYPNLANFSFDLFNSRLGIGGISTPLYSIDIQTTTGIHVSGGSIYADAKGLMSVPTASLFSTLPTSLFYPNTIPITTLQATGTLTATNFIGDGSGITNVSLGNINLNPNTIPLSALASTGQIWIHSSDTNGKIIAPYISSSYIESKSALVSYLEVSTLYSRYISTSLIEVSSLLIKSFTASNLSSINIETNSIRANNFYGDGRNLTSINPANLLTTIPANKFAFGTVSYEVLQDFGNFLLRDGTFTIGNSAEPFRSLPVSITGTVDLNGQLNVNGNSLFLKNINAVKSVIASSFIGDGSQLYNLNAISSLTLYAAISSFSTALGVIVGSGGITSNNLISTVTGLGSAGYVSTSTLYTEISSFSTALGKITGGGGGGNVIYTDAWVQSNLISPPSSIFFGTPIYKPSQIFIPWASVNQISVGFQSNLLNVITSLTAIVSTSAFVIPTGIANSTILSNVSTGYVRIALNDVPLTGIVLVKAKGTSGIQTTTFPAPDGNIRKAFFYFEPALETISPTNNTLIAWYSNYNINYIAASSIFDGFLTASGPSAPRSPTAVSTATTIAYSFTAPLLVDRNDPDSLLTISAYDVSYNSVQSILPFGGYRYPPLVPQTTVGNNFFTNNPSPYTITAYPDSGYMFGITAKNSAGFWGLSTNMMVSTNWLAAPAFTSVTFPSRFATSAFLLSNNQQCNNVLNDYTSWLTSPFTIPIHYFSNRGTTATNIMSSITYFQPSGALANETIRAGLSFNGFPAGQPSPSSNSNTGILLCNTNVYDNYFASGAQCNGFYLNTSNTLTIDSSLHIGSSTIYTLYIQQEQYNPVPIPSLVQQTTSYFCEDDSIRGVVPTITDFRTRLESANSQEVSGIYVINSATLMVSTTVNNIGKWFYNNPVLVYTGLIGGTTPTFNENNLVNATSGCNRGQLSPLVQFSNNAINATSLTSVFSTSIGFTAVTCNIFNPSLKYGPTYVSTIIDGPSIELINNTTLYPASLPQLVNGTSLNGRRIWSYSNLNSDFVPTNDNTTPIYYNISPSNSFTDLPYSNSLSIASGPNQFELQIFNGGIRAKGTNPFGYLDYRNTYYNATQSNTLDYSGITTSGYRFATYGWRVADNSIQYSGLNFTITTKSDSVAASGFPIKVGGIDLIITYKVEDLNTLDPIISGANSITSTWINANLGTNSVGNSTYFVQTSPLYGGTLGTPSLLVANTISINVYIPAISGSFTRRFILRIGIPMSVNFAIQSVSAKVVG